MLCAADNIAISVDTTLEDVLVGSASHFYHTVVEIPCYLTVMLQSLLFGVRRSCVGLFPVTPTGVPAHLGLFFLPLGVCAAPPRFHMLKRALFLFCSPFLPSLSVHVFFCVGLGLVSPTSST